MPRRRATALIKAPLHIQLLATYTAQPVKKHEKTRIKPFPESKLNTSRGGMALLALRMNPSHSCASATSCAEKTWKGFWEFRAWGFSSRSRVWGEQGPRVQVQFAGFGLYRATWNIKGQHLSTPTQQKTLEAKL